MQALVGADLFCGYGVGRLGEVRLSHLQFEDDTLIIGEKSWLNVRSMRAVLLLFEEVSELKVNFHKSLLTGVNVSDTWLSKAASVMNCRTGSITFVYLGLPIGGDVWKLIFWKPVIDRIVAHLSSWNNKFLSFGGRLILLKFVMPSLLFTFFPFSRLPHDHVHDKWRWLLDPIHGYSVRGAYHLLTTSTEPMGRSTINDVWHKQIPSKVSLFAWRLLRNGHPIKDSLVRRRVLQPNDNLCVGRCGDAETMDHLFLGCGIFGSIWFLVWQWLGISSVSFGVLRDHFVQFPHMAGMPRFSHSFLKVIWLDYVCVIWKERNQRVFKNMASDPYVLIDKVKMNSFFCG